ncbi:hypothetical protein B0H14DRAFT_3765155 [Mycena olivaceomarginata]|nr:hypothetical protein B0H14DRAFT_3765155 [Mycena olivaceomarginata]
MEGAFSPRNSVLKPIYTLPAFFIACASIASLTTGAISLSVRDPSVDRRISSLHGFSIRPGLAFTHASPGSIDTPILPVPWSAQCPLRLLLQIRGEMSIEELNEPTIDLDSYNAWRVSSPSRGAMTGLRYSPFTSPAATSWRSSKLAALVEAYAIRTTARKLSHLPAPPRLMQDLLVRPTLPHNCANVKHFMSPMIRINSVYVSMHPYSSNVHTNIYVTIYTDNMNTVQIFSSLAAEPAYNILLKAAVDLLLKYRVDLRVLHIPGDDNTIADALSRSNWGLIHALLPCLRITSFQPPQQHRTAWPIDELLRKRAVALGMALDKSSHSAYTSATNSYLHFCDIHHFDLDPTPETLSLYTVYMCHHIDPRSVNNYLSGISSELEPFYPEVRQNRKSMLVSRTLKGCKRMLSRPIRRKQPLSRTQIQHILDQQPSPPSHDDLLFAAMLLTAFYGLLRLGELTAPDTRALRNPAKWTLRSSVEWLFEGFAFLLQSHKTDLSFEGSRVVIPHRARMNAIPAFRRVPRQPRRAAPSQSLSLAVVLDRSFAGQSLRAGGATALAEDGVPYHLIQAAGRWSSETFQIYIRKNPVFLQILLGRQRAS